MKIETFSLPKTIKFYEGLAVGAGNALALAEAALRRGEGADAIVAMLKRRSDETFEAHETLAGLRK